MLAVIQVGIDQNMLNEDDFIELYKYRLSLIPAIGYSPIGFYEYINNVNATRSRSIYELRSMGIRGSIRARYNNEIDYLTPDYRQYLYKVDNKCKLCGFIIVNIRYATIDHIVERCRGGSAGIENQQLAHPWCNVLKSANSNKKSPTP
jgi:hypothetical protein